MMKRLLSALFLSAVLTGVASATPMAFTLQNVTFTDGGSATGSFVYDPVSGTLISFDVTTTADASLSLPAFTFDPTSSATFGISSTGFQLISHASFPDPKAPQPEHLVLALVFDSPLTASGSPIAIDASSHECLDCNPVRFVSSGSVVATPEPCSLALLGSGCLGFVGVLRKRFV